MATQISPDAEKVVATAPTGFQDYAMQNAPGDKLTSGEAARLLGQFQTTPYSGANVVAAIAGTTPTYNYNDPYGARSSIEQRLGYGDATAAEEAAQKSLLGFQDTTRATINSLRANRDLSTGLEAGFESQRTREATQQEQVLANELQLAQNKRLALENKVSQEYDIYTGERNKREAAMLDAMQYGAKVDMGMSLTDIAKAGTSAKKKYEEKTAKDKYKSDLKSTAMSLGIKTKGNTKELEKRITKYYKEQGASKKEMDAIELALKKKSLSSSSSKSTTIKDYTGTEQRLLANELFNEAVGQGLYGGYTYQYIKEQGESLGIDTSEGGAFDNAIRSKFGQPATRL